MGFNHERFIHYRPFLYHTTALENVEHIRSEALLRPAALMLDQSDRRDLLDQKRSQSQPIRFQGRFVYLTSQKPLLAAHMDVTDNSAAFRSLVKNLNEHVFFWPGTADKLHGSGREHAGSDTGPQTPVTLRFPTADLFRLNSDPRFSKCNSGAPRKNNGKVAVRDNSLFVCCKCFNGGVSDVWEVVFSSVVALPHAGQVNQNGHWQSWGSQ